MCEWNQGWLSPGHVRPCLAPRLRGSLACYLCSYACSSFLHPSTLDRKTQSDSPIYPERRLVLTSPLPGLQSALPKPQFPLQMGNVLSILPYSSLQVDYRIPPVLASRLSLSVMVAGPHNGVCVGGSMSCPWSGGDRQADPSAPNDAFLRLGWQIFYRLQRLVQLW